MSANNAALIRQGVEAFLSGDFDALGELTEPDVQWLYWEPIPGDCHGREKVIATLRQRHAEGVVGGVANVVEGGKKLLVEITGPRLEQGGRRSAGRRWWSRCVKGGSSARRTTSLRVASCAGANGQRAASPAACSAERGRLLTVSHHPDGA